MNTRMVLIPSAGKGPATEDLETCGCGGAELKCWECGLAICSECARIRMIDGYEVVYCPACAPALSRGDE
jgi:hypothetical protein